MSPENTSPEAYDGAYADIINMQQLLGHLTEYLDVLKDKNTSPHDKREAHLAVGQCAEALNNRWKDLDTRFSVLGISALIEHARPGPLSR